jgi:polygalacturonase
MSIDNGLNYTGPVFNVKDFGAKGDGKTNDGTAIQDAINAANKVPGSTVYFPAGSYAVHMPLSWAPNGWALNPGSNTRFLGEGKDLTTIKVANNAKDSYLFQGSGSGLTFQNLTLDANTDNGAKPAFVVWLRGGKDIQFINVKIDAEGTNALDLHNSSRILIKDSEIIGEESFLGTAKQVFIDGSDFYGTGYTDMIIHGFGVQMLSVTNSTAQNLDTSDVHNGKWAKGRFFVDQAWWRISQNHYFGNNQTIDMAPPKTTEFYVDQNSGEQIMWEQPNNPSVWLGDVVSATSNAVTFDAAPTGQVNSNYFISIIGGKGIGQSRQVQSYDATTNTYTLADNWNILPDNSSVIVANQIVSKAVAYGNSLDGTTEAYQSPTHIASAGIQAYYGATDLIIDNNSFHELRQGVSLWSGWYDTDTMPVYFTQVTNNKFQDTLTGVAYPLISGEKGSAILGNSNQNNSFDNVDNAFDLWVNYGVNDNLLPNANMNIFEDNSFVNVGNSLVVDPKLGTIDNNLWL